MEIAPQLDEEESESITIPAAYRCDACAAVAYQLQVGLQAAEARRPGRQLRVAELLEAFEDAEAGLCAQARCARPPPFRNAGGGSKVNRAQARSFEVQ